MKNMCCGVDGPREVVVNADGKKRDVRMIKGNSMQHKCFRVSRLSAVPGYKG